MVQALLQYLKLQLHESKLIKYLNTLQDVFERLSF